MHTSSRGKYIPLSAEHVSTFNEQSGHGGTAIQSYLDTDATSVSYYLDVPLPHTVTLPPASDDQRALAKLSTERLAGVSYLPHLGENRGDLHYLPGF